MRTRFLFALMMCCFLGFGQTNPIPSTGSGKKGTKKIIKVEAPLSSTAFDSLIIGELNFMVLGDDNVKQGISYEYKENNTELNLSGKLHSTDLFIMTVDGKFSIDSGAFIFDETDGSKKGKLTLNFFFNLPWNSKFYRTLDESKPNEIDSRRAMIQNKVQSMALADSIHYKIKDFEAILGTLKIPHVSIKSKKFDRQRAMLDKTHTVPYDYTAADYNNITANKERLLKRLKVYYKKGGISDFDVLIDTLNKEPVKETYQILDNDDNVVDSFTIAKIFKLEKLLKDYQESYARLENYTTENNKLEIATFKKYWIGARSWYAGVSPFYERQGFDIYNPNLPSTTIFKDRFNQINSDLYGVGLSLNHVRVFKNRSFYIIRLLNAIGRSNNFAEYDKKDYSFTSSSENVNGIPIEVTKVKTGYINKAGRNYEYGTFTNLNLELYVAPIPVAGVFGKIGYSKNDALLKEETYPFETGILINLKSKDKKNIVAIQLFMSRLNLNEHPDDDMNFGLKIGLPINISKD
ncbi:hypothetical protein [Flavobacterium sp. UBA7682]|uniref:hypothetical protein n=1 Tax=Flavobacterium sp. UBA7682 TaxID=1946560 RepID=UPI0025C73249|nr:hypothetical protein [Flavobacterium sp. UBA7682]